MPLGCTTGTRDVSSGSRWAWSAPAPGRTDGWIVGRADTCGMAWAERRPVSEIAARIPVRFRVTGAEGERGVQIGGEKGRCGAAGGRGRGRCEQARGLETETRSRLRGKEVKDGQRDRGQDAGRAGAGNAIGTEGYWDTAERRHGDPAARSLCPPPLTPHVPPPVSAALGSAAARGLGYPARPQPGSSLGPYLGLGGGAPRGAERGGIRRTPPKGRTGARGRP